MEKRQIIFELKGEAYDNEKGICTVCTCKIKGNYIDIQTALAVEIKTNIRLKSLLINALQHAEILDGNNIEVEQLPPSV